MFTVYLAMLSSEEDRERFTLLYEAHEKRLYAVALKILGNPTRAEDAAQQAWLQVLRNWERVNALDWDAAARYLAVAAKNAALDLLKKENLDGQAAEYIEVLDRQSRRLKKLTEDLVEASKASTGNLKVQLAPTDMGELAAQAVAEYEEKLENAHLEAVINGGDTPLFAMVDGNLTWRVLSNLLSNACKYSQPYTRVYIDIKKEKDTVILSMKNISRDALNIPAEELMERFVRGDSSRHTEGSGLGLNIAQSLVGLQKGTFSLEIEGDLFKAFVAFPATEPPAPPAEEMPEEEMPTDALPMEDMPIEEMQEETEKGE